MRGYHTSKEISVPNCCCIKSSNKKLGSTSSLREQGCHQYRQMPGFNLCEECYLADLHDKLVSRQMLTCTSSAFCSMVRDKSSASPSLSSAGSSASCCTLPYAACTSSLQLETPANRDSAAQAAVDQTF